MKFSKVGSDPLPRTLRWGVAYQQRLGKIQLNEINNTIVQVTYALDRTFILVGDVDPSWKSSGIEFTFFETASYRNGNFKDIKDYRIGETWGWGIQSDGIVKLLGLPHYLQGLQFNWSDDSEIYDFPTENTRMELGYQYRF